MAGDVPEALFELLQIGCRYAHVQRDVVRVEAVHAFGHAACSEHVLIVRLTKQNNIFYFLLHGAPSVQTLQNTDRVLKDPILRH